ncbi:MAG: BPL-N domain-containing protein [Alphaproteobacteria bacterium]|nr:BPL-N domain-containing protein [Alphaproteobacteria bacterium]
MKNIIVYQDLMASTQALLHMLKRRYAAYDVEIIQAGGEDVRAQKYPNKDTLAFFMPGTPSGSSAYREQLQQDGFDYLVECVKGGVDFYGICAGAYLAADKFSYKFLQTGELRKIDSPLAIIEGRADGPIIDLVHPDRFSAHSGMSAVSIEFNTLAGDKDRTKVFYSTGPVLTVSPKAQGDYQVLARFNEAARQPIVALRRLDLGGTVNVSAFPFEYGDQEYINYIDPQRYLPQSFYDEMDKIAEYQDARHRFCDVFLAPIDNKLSLK